MVIEHDFENCRVVVCSLRSEIHKEEVWPPVGKKKFETLSYLPPLTEAQLAKKVEYVIRKGWIPCLEFKLEKGFVYRESNRSPGYYDGRYWTMWKLPMFGYMLIWFDISFPQGSLSKSCQGLLQIFHSEI